MKVEYEVELAHTPEVLIQHLDKQVNELCALRHHVKAYLKIRQLVIPLIYAESEIQACVAAVDYFVISELNKIWVCASTYLKKIGVFGLPLHDLSMHFDLNFPPLWFVVGDVPAGQAGFALPVLQQNEANLNNN